MKVKFILKIFFGTNEEQISTGNLGLQDGPLEI